MWQCLFCTRHRRQTQWRSTLLQNLSLQGKCYCFSGMTRRAAPLGRNHKSRKKKRIGAGQHLLGRAQTKNCKLWLFHIKTRVEKKSVPNLHFWAKSAGHSDDLQSNLFFPRSIRIDFSRSVIFNLVQRVLPEEIRFFARNLIGFFLRPLFFDGKTSKSFKNRCFTNRQKFSYPVMKDN